MAAPAIVRASSLMPVRAIRAITVSEAFDWAYAFNIVMTWQPHVATPSEMRIIDAIVDLGLGLELPYPLESYTDPTYVDPAVLARIPIVTPR